MNFIYFFAGLIGGGAIVGSIFQKKKDTVDIKNILSPLETKLNEFTSAFQSAYRDEELTKEAHLKVKLKL